MSQYGWPFEVTMRCPLRRAFALYAAIGARLGRVFKGPTYREQEMIAALTSGPA